ncbi:MAG: hypothetical protein DI536_35820 [Archangium gephyra]|uniref:Uncharacterized protein n=1 Tax=Archangium gephyra TaxID=48 RepID=A0A2W5UJV9_9BACT|nr:MAG: hypothetical protein DI536_35820 [Archangium gephyra]
MNETITLQLGESGAPTQMQWAGVEYRVTDTPTPLEDELLLVTHPPACRFGWRFQGQRRGGENFIFDVRYDRTLDGWILVHAYG